ncbi:hypothetical protein Clacol_005344 [Clathrus columnatus]|uniref:ENTH domain-containing protein n=1 Tax=Clathrus columnatus TaxID=1419009 RepID=A0AAV5AEL7_9AGAM|nr:hypothetical protein Clacol_005344 [Clathrus columnatus]
MSSFDKVVKLACKPKAAPPKAKYLDPIIAATWSEDGAVADVCKALTPRFREPNAIVVFKALIVLHTMIRNGATDNVLSYLASEDVLRLRNVATGQWDGYDAPQNLKHYAFYLDSRIHAYRELKHDAIRVQSESNRDLRVSQSVDEGRALASTVSGSGSSRGRNGSGGGLQRSKTLAGRKLRVMTVEKGLLRETKVVQRMIDALLDCRSFLKFYQENVEDELTGTALRMLVKDVLVLFQAVNEGVINVLESYFEMSHIDAEQALVIYRHFCKQAERVMEYLTIARKLENILNIPIPQLRHAPVSLAGSLEEYLKDPNFEQNRLEYKANKAAADKASSNGSSRAASKSRPQTSPSSSVPPVPKFDSAAASSPSKPAVKTNVDDFFESIEKENQTSATSPSVRFAFQVPPSASAVNPFLQQQVGIVHQQFTGVIGAQGPFIHQQPTGFIQPQHTAIQVNPFSQFQQPTQQTQAPFQGNPFPQTQHSLPPQNSSPFPPQGALETQPTGFLQPQATGSNPFRQSVVIPQATGFSPFGTGAVPPLPSFPQGPPITNNITGFNGFGRPKSPPVGPSPLGGGGSFANSNSPFNPPNRPQSTPLPNNQPQTQPLTAVTTHQTGSKNPFGQPVKPAPPVPKPPTLQELATGAFSSNFANPNGLTTGPFGAPTGGFAGSGLSGIGSTSVPQRPSSPKAPSQQFNSSVMSSIASSFATKSTNENASSPTNPFPFLTSQNTATTNTTSDFSNSLSTQPTGSTAPTAFSISSLQPQQTGFGGIKPFKPTSSFGASLLESLPPIADSPSVKPAFTGINTNPTGFPNFNSASSNPGTNSANPSLPFGTTTGSPKPQSPVLGALNAQTTGKPFFGLNSNGAANSPVSSGLTGGLRPQITGGGANPFRASVAVPSTTPSFSSVGPLPNFTAFSSTTTTGLLPNPTGGTALFNNNNFPAFGQPSFNVSTQQDTPTGSLI